MQGSAAMPSEGLPVATRAVVWACSRKQAHDRPTAERSCEPTSSGRRGGGRHVLLGAGCRGRGTKASASVWSPPGNRDVASPRRSQTGHPLASGRTGRATSRRWIVLGRSGSVRGRGSCARPQCLRSGRGRVVCRADRGHRPTASSQPIPASHARCDSRFSPSHLGRSAVGLAESWSPWPGLLRGHRGRWPARVVQ